LRKFFPGFLAVLLPLVCSLSAAAMTLDPSVCYQYNSKDGSTMAIGIFQIAGYSLPDGDMSLYEQAFNATDTKQGMLTYTSGNTLSQGNPAIMMFLFDNSRDALNVDFSGGEMLCREQLHADVFVFNYPTLKFMQHANISTIPEAKMPLGKIIRTGTTLNILSDDGSDCRVEVPAERYTIIDDRAGASDGSSGVLGWLNEFWDKLVGLIVPDDDYFDRWYDEIKTAANDKFGGLSQLYEIMRDAFAQLQDDNIVTTNLWWHIDAGEMFEGSPAIKVDVIEYARPYLKWLKPVLTMIILVYTAIACYRRIVVLFEQ